MVLGWLVCTAYMWWLGTAFFIPYLLSVFCDRKKYMLSWYLLAIICIRKRLTLFKIITNFSFSYLLVYISISKTPRINLNLKCCAVANANEQYDFHLNRHNLKWNWMQKYVKYQKDALVRSKDILFPLSPSTWPSSTSSSSVPYWISSFWLYTI